MVSASRPTQPASMPSVTKPQMDWDVAIVGGGIVGLTLAAALKDSGLRVVLIEAEERSAAVDRGQAYAISLLSSRVFQGMGVWDRIRPRIEAFTRIRLSDADDPGVVHFHPTDLGTTELGYVAEHRVLLEELQTFVSQCGHVTRLCPARVIATQTRSEVTQITLEYNGQEHPLLTRLVVAADGARSPLRQQTGIPTHGWQYWQSCIVATIRPEKPHGNTAYERFWPSGPFAILPLPENRCRIVWTAPRTEAEALVNLDDRAFLAELRRRYGHQMGELTLEPGRYVFPVRLMQSSRYIHSRLALVGDAAHCCHPVGGQGLNMGIRDAAALAQVLVTAHQQGEDIGASGVLGRYDRWRRWENLVILGFTDFLVRCFSNNWLPMVLIRRFGLWLLRTVRPLKTIALRLMTGLSGRLPHLAHQNWKSL